MNVIFNPINLFKYGNGGNRSSQTRNELLNLPAKNKQGNPIEAAYGMSAARMLSRCTSKQQNQMSSDIVSDCLGYSNYLRTQRNKKTNVFLQKKKLQYDFKQISSQILRSKTSTSARQVASKARREVLRLKRQSLNGQYDAEELKAAIAHAKAMERVARKKVRHLQEEEMVKAAGGPCSGELEERLMQDEDEAEAADSSSVENMQDSAEAQMQESIETEMQENIEAQMQEMVEAEMQETIEEEMQMYQEMLQDTFQDMLEELGIDDLMEGLDCIIADKDMDPADFKLLKIKHRSDEMKAIAKADMEYLKATFERYEKLKSCAAPDISSSTGGTPSMAMPSSGIVPTEGMSLGCDVGASIDISL